MTAHRGSWTLSPCVCLDAGGTLWTCIQTGGYCIFSSLLILGVATLLPLLFRTSAHKQHARNHHLLLSPPLLSWTTLKTKDVHVLCWLGLQKNLGFLGGKIALLSALCMFFKASEKTHFHISSHLTDGSLPFSSYLIFVYFFWFCFLITSLCSVRKALKHIIPSGMCNWEAAVITLKRTSFMVLCSCCCCHFGAAERLVYPVVTFFVYFLADWNQSQF